MVKPIDNSRCDTPLDCQRRVFWATQADACIPEDDCSGAACATPGLKLINIPDECNTDALGCYDSSCANPALDSLGITIDTSKYVEGLALNILLTDSRKPDTECGWLPGRRGGHWSETFIEGGGARVGSRVRFHSGKGSIQQQVNEIEALAQEDLSKLVTYGVATKVQVKATYLGRATVGVIATIFGPTGAEIGRVGISGQRAANGWVWNQ